MKILLVNNNTVHMPSLHAALAGHDVEVVKYRPGVELDDTGKDLVILSGGGGEGCEIDDTVSSGHLWYEDEMNFVQRCKAPMIGICMGFEVMCRAYGEDVVRMKQGVEDYMVFQATEKGEELFDADTLMQYEAHEWHVPEIRNRKLEELARSQFGVEVVRDGNRIATQFHPELGGTVTLPQLVHLATAA